MSWTAADGLAAATLAAAVWFLYGSITRLWWTGDDLFHLHFITLYSPLAYSFSPRVWSLFPSRMFTPLQLLSYQTDLALFGRNSSGFFAHQLLVFSVGAIAVYAALRNWLSPRFAWVAAVLFVLGIPSVSWVIELMFRHYIEGLIWATLALAFFVKALRRRHWALLGLSSLFYFLSMLEKEVYVPLLALLLVLPESTFRLRLRSLWPHALALLLYSAWRWAMLGTLFGGYGWATRSRELPGLIVGLPIKLGASLVGGLHTSGVVLLACLLAGVCVLIWRRPMSVPVLVTSAILILGPIVPIAKAVSERFATLPWLLVTIAFVFGCRELAGGSPRARVASGALLLLAIAAALIGNRLDWRRRYSGAERASAEGRFFLTMQPGDLLRHPRIPAAAMQETRWLKEEYLRLPRGSGWFADDIYLCGAGKPRGRIWEYKESAKQVREVTGQALDAAVRYCSGLRSAPLWASFESSDGSLFWKLGPYGEGTYSLVFEKGVGSFVVAHSDGYRTNPELLSLMVRYESPEGWVTYSPELVMDFRVATRFRWERQAGKP